MARTKLTTGRIRDYECPTGKAQSFLWDSETPGLAVRATPGSQSRGFIFQSRLNGKALRMTIGDVRVWTIDAARVEARRLQTLIDQGVDPRQEKAERLEAAETKREEARRIERTALEAWGSYIKARRPRWGERHLESHLNASCEGGEPRTTGRRPGESDKTQPGMLRPLLLLPLSQIDASSVRAWLADNVASRPTAAALHFRLLRAFLNWCADRPEYQSQVNVGACAPRVGKEILPKAASKSDCLQREQLRAWFDAVLKLPPVQAAYLQVVLLIGPRKHELTRLRWIDVDFRWDSMTIRDKAESKGGLDGTRTIPLTPYVKSLLQRLKVLNETPPPQYRILDGKKIENDLKSWKPSEFVFWSARSASGHIEEPSSAHERAVEAAGIPNLTLQGLRRSFATLSEWAEAPEGAVAQIQGHKPSATREKHYKKRPLDLLRVWHIKIESWILEQADIEQPPDTHQGFALASISSAA